MPRGIIHHEGILLSLGHRISGKKSTYGLNCGLIVEGLRLRSEQYPGLWDDESAVRCLEPPWERFYCRGTSFLVPGRGHRRLYLKVDFVLVGQDQRVVPFDFGPFFLKASRSSVSS